MLHMNEPNSMTSVRFAILGFGRHASFRLVPAFAASSEATLTGLWRRNPEQAAADAAQHSIRAFTTPEALCASPDVDAVFIASPDALHLAHAQLAFAHGKAVLCEKPLAMTAAEAEAMLAAASSAGTLFGVAHNFRFNASVQHMRDRILAGDIGTPRTAHAEFNYAADRSPRTWIADASLACGGPIGDVGVHCIDTLRFLLSADAETVSTLATQDALSGKLEASASLQLQLTSDILATVNVSARAAYRTVVEIVGSDGALVSENCLTVDRPVDVQLRKGGELIDTRTFSNADGYTRMLDNFARAMRGRNSQSAEPFLAPGSEGVRNQHILDAAYRSWRTGQRERI
jgi:predicted dehydrogenase